MTAPFGQVHGDGFASAWFLCSILVEAPCPQKLRVFKELGGGGQGGPKIHLFLIGFLRVGSLSYSIQIGKITFFSGAVELRGVCAAISLVFRRRH